MKKAILEDSEILCLHFEKPFSKFLDLETVKILRSSTQKRQINVRK
jgi:hypothetical protein